MSSCVRFASRITGPDRSTSPSRAEWILRQPGLQRLIAVEASARVHQELGCPSQDEAEMTGAALKHVVEDAQDLLKVPLPGLGRGQLVEVDQLVERHEQPLVAGFAHK